MADTPAAIASYAPAWLRRMALNDGRLPEAGLAVPLIGAVLLADVSGFTPLADRLAARGPAGAEELSRLLGDYFGRLLALVGDHGGEAIKFAGDALIAMWPAGDGDTAAAVQRAAACALAIQAQLHLYETTAGTRLSLRVAVLLGATSGVVLTSGGRAYGALLGAPFADAARALARSQPGDAIVTAPAWATIVARAEATPAAHGCWRLMHVDDAPAAAPEATALPAVDWAAAPGLALLEAFVPEPARARLSAGHGEWLGELRQVSALFAMVGGLDPAAPHAGATLQKLMNALEPIVRRCGGHVREVGIDDKGLLLVAVFGLPPHGHEGGEARATRAALDIHAALGAAGHPGALGVATGRCYTGVVGNDQQREYAIIGDAMNVAARLMEAAARDRATSPVLCDAATVHGAESRFEFQHLPDLVVKGKAEPLRVARPVQPRRFAPAVSSTLVGRDAECRAVAERVSRCAAGQAPGVMIVQGDAGMGKSRLVHDLGLQAARAGVRTLAGGADAVEVGTPYFVWRGVFSALLGGSADEVLKALGPRRSPRAPLLEAVLHLGLPDTPETQPLSGQQRATATRELLLELLAEAVAAGPTAVVLEDGHWFDGESWTLALEAGRRMPQLMLVVTTRPLGEADSSQLQALSSLPGSGLVTLSPLRDEDTLALVCAKLGVPALPSEVHGLICSRASGLPLFAEELAMALVDTEVIEVADGVCTLAPGFDPASLALPETVQGVVGARLDRLPPSEALAIKVGSVIGTAFEVRVLSDVYPVHDDRARLYAVLEHLQRANLTVLESPHPKLAYAFKHVILRDVAYNLLLYAQRRQLHQAVAEWYEAHYGDDRPELLAVMAHHWSRAGVTDKAVASLERCATRTFSMGLGRAAVAHGLEAARLLGVHLPTDPAAIGPLLGAEVARIERLLAGREPSALLEHVPLEDERAGRVIGLLLQIMPFAHQSAQGELFALMALRCMSLTLLHGNGPAAPVVYAMHSIVYRALTGNTAEACRFAELALELDRRRGQALMPTVSFIYTWFNQHWVYPLERGLAMSLAAAEAGLASGDVLYACFNLAAHVVYLAAAGRPLPEVMEAARRHHALNGGRVYNSDFHCIHELQMAKALAGLTVEPTSLTDAEFDEARDVASICATDNYNQIGFYLIGRLKLLYWFGDYAQALECAAQAQGLLQAYAGQTGEVEHATFQGLALLARARELPAPEAAPLLDQAAALLARIERWAELSTENFRHKALLLRAELTRETPMYAEAAAAAAAAGYRPYAALAHELHARTLRAAGDAGWRGALARAREAYLDWGALAKVDHLDRWAA